MNDVLLRDLAEIFHLIPRSITPVTGGWMNRKWKITADGGDFLVKQYSLQRFGERQLQQIDQALRRQMRLHAAGIPCPRILLCGDCVLRWADAETVYMVMEFFPGGSVTPETVTLRQMHSLGDTLGHIHREFAHIPPDGVKGYPMDGAAGIDALRSHSRTSSFAAAMIQPILEKLPPPLFSVLPRGIAHEDFTPDNILFNDAGVAAVLDFDRNQYSFLHHDIGRALLSLAWRDGAFDSRMADALCRGYAAHLPLTEADLADALRITWCIEAPWWIREDIRTGGSPKVRRFLDEILWVGENWDALDALVRQ